MSDDPTVRGPLPDEDPERESPEPEPELESSEPVPSEPVPPSRMGGAASQVALGMIVFTAALLLLLGATRLTERGGIASAPTVRPSSSAPMASIPSPPRTRTPGGSPAAPSGSPGPTAPLASGQTPAPTSGDPVLVGAGDIGDCASNGDEATAAILDDIEGTVFTAGDDAYPSGTATDFKECYDPSWGRHKARTRPAPGSHDWETRGLAGYFGYFGAAAQGPGGTSWYSYDVGTWHVIVLDSMCDNVGGCDPASAQGIWLAADLAANPAVCTIAIWHHPRFTSGEHGDLASMDGFWRPLYAAGVDVVVNGLDHDYERFAPQAPDGRADPDRGIREFVVGTGGTALRDFVRIGPNSEVRVSSLFGVLAITLHPDAYDWEFIPSGSDFRDHGTSNCH